MTARATIHPTAVVHPNAVIGDDAEIGPYCVVGEHVKIGERTRLLAHIVVNGYTTIGADCRVYPFTSIGMASQDRKYHGERSYTTIGDRTILREYVSVNRATGEGQVTAVGNDCLLLAYVHIAHNCTVGDFVTMSNNAQLAGHITVEEHAVIGGMSGFHQFVRVGAYAMVGGMTAISRDVPPYLLIGGNPAEAFGLNLVGLRRAGFAPETLTELKECYRLFYRSGNNISQARAALAEHVKTAEGRRFLAFIEAESDRGILK